MASADIANILTNHRILVAEDNADDAFLLKRAFMRAGVKVPMEFVRDGQEAIAYLQGASPTASAATDRGVPWAPSLLLLDLKMPGVDGFEVLEWVRAHERLRCLPIIVFSSSPFQEDIDRAYYLGANAYMVKPVESKELQKVVQGVSEYWLNLNLAPGATTSHPL